LFFNFIISRRRRRRKIGSIVEDFWLQENVNVNALKRHPPPKTPNFKTSKMWEHGFLTPLLTKTSTI
jgi:hypothetical protein